MKNVLKKGLVVLCASLFVTGVFATESSTTAPSATPVVAAETATAATTATTAATAEEAKAPVKAAHHAKKHHHCVKKCHANHGLHGAAHKKCVKKCVKAKKMVHKAQAEKTPASAQHQEPANQQG